MRGSPFSIRVFRFLLVLTLAFVCLGAPPRALTIVLAFTGCIGLWLLSALCIDAKAIRKALEEDSPIHFQGSQPILVGSEKTEPTSLVDGVAIRKLGDRVFKADESKTCRTCRSFEHQGPVCLLDDESLAGITIAAVGCQHWSPGLKIAEELSDEET